jgi:hypothetical protein
VHIGFNNERGGFDGFVVVLVGVAGELSLCSRHLLAYREHGGMGRNSNRHRLSNQRTVLCGAPWLS